ncbi:MotA/TolQ/ExbB proton channel family protein [Intestinicryptomonas porci]|uniref:MotA/TolQ/ExbB proton channel family protein n=1 Tax=Intestinicryptomonas porci TaxID=2926320 RepID=A0ABU4WHR7_9BACT|nr:MotA/TolQ/ExbB proton channel family protein [Opitutales bacterium CLA-KB-P66]
MEKLLNIFYAGGPMMVPIVLSAFVVALLFLERFLYLHKGQIKAVDFVDGLKNSLKDGRLTEALTICEETPCPVSRVVKAALLTCESGRTVIVDSVRAAALLELPMLQRRISSIMLIAKIAPLMGMIGTVLALLQIFNKISETGSYFTVDIFSAQIYNALVSTVAGLLLCLTAWVMYALLLGRVRAIAHDIDWAANEMVLFIEKGMPENEGLRLLEKSENGDGTD